MKDKLIKLFSSGLGLGYIPIASGTWGTLLGIPLAYLVSFLNPLLKIILVIAFVFLSIYVADLAEKLFNKKDDSRIVIDEIAGFLVTMIFSPINFLSVLVGFLLFRFFDVVKPWPANWSQGLTGGWGVVIDDIFAGMYGALILYIIYKFNI